MYDCLLPKWSDTKWNHCMFGHNNNCGNVVFQSAAVSPGLTLHNISSTNPIPFVSQSLNFLFALPISCLCSIALWCFPCPMGCLQPCLWVGSNSSPCLVDREHKWLILCCLSMRSDCWGSCYRWEYLYCYCKWHSFSPCWVICSQHMKNMFGNYIFGSFNVVQCNVGLYSSRMFDIH